MSDEPQIHSHYEDSLPDDHPLAFKTVYCGRCKTMVHCGNNECMSTWVEWQKKQICLDCFVEVQPDLGVLKDLPNDIEEWNY